MKGLNFEIWDLFQIFKVEFFQIATLRASEIDQNGKFWGSEYAKIEIKSKSASKQKVCISKPCFWKPLQFGCFEMAHPVLWWNKASK